jgi:hypothetical protein
LDSIIAAASDQCRDGAVNKPVLVVMDRTQYNFYGHRKRLNPEGFGPLRRSGSQFGFFAQVAMAVDQTTGLPLGLADQFFWARDPKRKNKHERDYKRQPLEEKESYHWLTRSLMIKEKFKAASHLTFIADAETDMYPMLSEIPDEKTDILIRCCRDRKLSNSDLNLFDFLASREILGRYQAEIKADILKNRQKRNTIFEVRHSKVCMSRSQRLKTGYPEEIELHAIEVREKADKVPNGEEPVLWRLITSREISSLADAIKAVEDYRGRWNIEQLFRCSKSQGINIEESQLETAQALKKLASFSLFSCLKIMLLTMGRDEKNELKAKIIFDPEEIALLHLLLKQYQGKTTKQKNPFKTETIPWAAWIIARIGGWKGLYSQHPPGPITIKRGLTDFNKFKYGYDLSQDVYKG